jgi:hypothetical protein
MAFSRGTGCGGECGAGPLGPGEQDSAVMKTTFKDFVISTLGAFFGTRLFGGESTAVCRRNG